MDMKADNVGPFIDDFHVVSEFNAQKLNTSVNKKRDEGYIIHGLPFVFGDSVCQTMVKLNSDITRILKVTMDLAVDQIGEFERELAQKARKGAYHTGGVHGDR